MNIKSFSVASTNLFPATNTTNGGQLLTEFNLRAKDSVLSTGTVDYVWGPAYTHGFNDFLVQTDNQGANYFLDTSTSAGSTLVITPGRAIINGYYVENITAMVIDLAAINSELAVVGQSLSGECCIGLRVMLSAETTMLGSIMGEDANGYYEGIQVVILPKTASDPHYAFHTPLDKFIYNGETIDCGSSAYQSYVTADLLLATFNYNNGAISNLVQNPNKTQGIPANRIQNIDDIISTDYVKKTGLNPKKLYTFAGKGIDPNTGNSTWCDSTDSLMVWDNNPQFTPIAPTDTEANFRRSSIDPDQVQLIVPHKQVDGMTDGQNNAQFYMSKAINLPKADYSSGTSGLVTKAYTDSVKAVNARIDEFYQLTGGTQRGFIAELNPNGTQDGQVYKKLPTINDSWSVGDYILVGRDYSVMSELTDSANIAPPSTIYVVLPGIVKTLATFTSTKPSGVCLDTYDYKVPDEGLGDFQPSDEVWWDLDTGNYRGTVGVDYFQTNLIYNNGTVVSTYKPVATTNGIRTYSEAIQLTGSVPFASETLTGGFLNAPDDYIDAGYVYLDAYGHLRLRDYALLRSGMLAYQLGQDVTIESGLTVSEIQAQLNEYVNQRIAFPDITQTINSLTGTASTSVINVTITLPDDTDEEVSLTVSGIDSRFNTAVCINIYGTATTNTTVNITDCAKVRVQLFGGTPKIVVKRSCLYYDYKLFNTMYSAEDITLWYTKFADTDKNLYVDGMTVRAVELQSMYNDPEANYNVVSSEYWTLDAQNDNHFDVALQSITFDGNATIVGCSVLVKNNSSSNVLAGKYLFRDNEFYLPQGPNLYYPSNCLRQAVNVTGRFISAYVNTGGASYIVQETDFSLKSQIVDTNGDVVIGEAAFLVNAYELNYANATNIDVFDPNKFHSFSGTTLL